MMYSVLPTSHFELFQRTNTSYDVHIHVEHGKHFSSDPKPSSILLSLPLISLKQLIVQRILALIDSLSHKLVVVSQQQLVLLLQLALGAAKGADGRVVDVGKTAADGAVAVDVALVVETVVEASMLADGLLFS